MKVYKVELLIVDHDEVGEEELRHLLENTRYPNHCLSPSVMNVQVRQVEWSDAHPLNKRGTMRDTYAALFEKKNDA